MCFCIVLSGRDIEPPSKGNKTVSSMCNKDNRLLKSHRGGDNQKKPGLLMTGPPNDPEV